MNDAKTCSCTKLGPIGCSGQPVQVVSEEGVYSCARVHNGIGKNHCPVTHAIAGFYAVLQVFEDLQGVA